MTWHVVEHHLIAIVAVDNTSDASPVVSFTPGNYPDLAQARELFPELTRLWDAVRHEFWTRLIPPQPLMARRQALA
ncbi:hypothetical protein AB0B25_29325 [Nocardia sp. NPDC049190]|uniref:hypothetical protein n=1 Tax=Nocardia sp. NPDC049190 TaxID=3155650 RepID=UPI0034042C30